MIKKYLPLTLLIWPYLIVIPFLPEIDIVVFYLPTLITVLFANILFACFYRDTDAVIKFVFWNLIIKLAHIPGYLVIFIFGFSFMIAIPLLFIIDAMLMISSSMYGINGLIQARKNGIISPQSMVLHIIFHLIFVLDVVSAINLYQKLSKRHAES